MNHSSNDNLDDKQQVVKLPARPRATRLTLPALESRPIRRGQLRELVSIGIGGHRCS
jgi:hypothetical protein